MSLGETFGLSILLKLHEVSLGYLDVCGASRFFERTLLQLFFIFRNHQENLKF